jgi:hypothetical protein
VTDAATAAKTPNPLEVAEVGSVGVFSVLQLESSTTVLRATRPPEAKRRMWPLDVTERELCREEWHRAPGLQVCQSETPCATLFIAGQTSDRPRSGDCPRPLLTRNERSGAEIDILPRCCTAVVTSL